MRSSRVAGQALARPLLAIPAGALIGAIVAVSFALQPVSVALLLAALLVLLPTLLLREVKLYWLTMFLVALQFDLKKYLVDGLAVLEKLGLGYQQIFVFAPEVRGSDLIFVVLLGLWVRELILGRRSFYFPRVGWLAVGFIAWAALSILKALHPYLGVVELVRQCKFGLVCLYALNNIDSKQAMKRVWIAVLIGLAVQAGVTLMRFQLQYYDSFFGEVFGRAESLQSDLRYELLQVDPTGETALGAGGLRASFGTYWSQGITGQLLLLGLPVAAVLCARNTIFPRRAWGSAVLFVLGVLALWVTFSRTSLIAMAVEIILCGWFVLRRRFVSKSVALALGLLTIVLGIAISPTIYEYMNRKMENVDVRFEQYETALRMIRANPLLGVGLNNSSAVAGDYTRYSFSLVDPVNHAADEPIHSFYLLLLVEIGFVGTILYLGFFCLIGREALRLSRRGGDPEIALAATMLLVALVGIATCNLTNLFFADGVETLVWFYAGTVIALQRMDRRAAHGEEGAGTDAGRSLVVGSQWESRSQAR